MNSGRKAIPPARDVDWYEYLFRFSNQRKWKGELE